MKAVIYSKDNCPYCVQAKNLLKYKNIELKEYVLGKDYTKEQLLELLPNARTVPQIFLDEEYIGGFEDLKRKLDNDNFFAKASENI